MVRSIGPYSGNFWSNIPKGKEQDPYDLDVKVEENPKAGDPIECRTEHNCSKTCSHNCSVPCGTQNCPSNGCTYTDSGSMCTC